MYPKFILDLAYSSARKCFFNPKVRDQELSFKNTLVLPFNSNLVAAKQLLKQLNINLVFSYKDTIKNSVIKNSPTNYLGCIYKVPCLSCNFLYIGQTSKDLKTRVNQHRYDINNHKFNNGIYVHISSSNHGVNLDNTSEILKCRNFVERNIIESSIIKYTNDCNMNLSPGMFTFDNILQKHLEKELNISKLLGF